MTALQSTSTATASATTTDASTERKCPLDGNDGGDRAGSGKGGSGKARLGDCRSFTYAFAFAPRSFTLGGVARLFALLLFLSLFVVGSVAFEVDGEGKELRLAGRATSTVTSRTTTPSSSTTAGSAVNGITVTSTSTPDLTLPTSFDTVSLTTNFTAASCPQFFASFLSNQDVQSCLPLSLLLKNSNSFFELMKRNAFTITRVIDATCNVPSLPTCASVMEALGRNIRLDNHCGADFRLGNPLVMEAYVAFISYMQVYAAGCLKSDTGSYCYVDAITNTTTISDAYIYYMPLGTMLPGGARPGCSSCLQRTMSIYAASAGNSSLPLWNTYIPAAEQINIACGPDFVSEDVVEISGSSSLMRPRSILLGFVVIAVVAMVM